MIATRFFLSFLITVLVQSTRSYNIKRSCLGVCDGNSIVCKNSAVSPGIEFFCIAAETACKRRCFNCAKRDEYESSVVEHLSLINYYEYCK